MDAKRAVDLVGGCGGPVFLRNMVKALGMMAWLNTQDDNARREAAQWALRHAKAFNAEKQRRLDARGRK